VTEQYPGRDSGFTLLELLVAITLIALMVGVMAAGLRFGIRSWDKAEQSAYFADQQSSVRAMLLRLLTAARPEFMSSETTDKRVFFEGESERVTLIAPLPAAIGHDIEGRQSLYAGGNDNAGNRPLMFAWELDLPAIINGAGASGRTTVLDVVSSLRFRYWGRLDDEPSASWHERWSGQTRLPQLVHIDIGLGNRPPLVIDARILATTPSACAFDVVTLLCRRL
jgi:general secretion pathway protein J